MKRYQKLLSLYYLKRNWNDEGIPNSKYVEELNILKNGIDLPNVI